MKSFLVLCLIVTTGAAELRPSTITVFAAASTTTALGELAAVYMKTHPTLTVVTSFGSSATLAKQIEQGAPADLFLSADGKWMDYLEGKALIAANSRRDLLANRLVFIAPIDKAPTLKVEAGFDLAAAFTGRLAIADPASVPAGIYAKEALTSLGWWSALEVRLAPSADVRAALRLVELGECDLGIVYASDAHVSTKVMTVAAIPGTLHTPIRYPIARTVSGSPHAPAFVAWLASPEAAAVFTRRGFALP